MSEEAVQHEAASVETPKDETQPEGRVFSEAYVKQLREEAAGYRVRLKEFEDQNKSEAEKTAERLAELERQNADYKAQLDRAGWIRDVAKETGLPVDAVEVLGGDSYESVLGAAERVKSLIPEQKTVIPAGVENDALPLNGDGIENALKKALGIN